MNNKIYLCIDLKVYASVECVERGLDPFEINLVVADQHVEEVQSLWQQLLLLKTRCP